MPKSNPVLHPGRSPGDALPGVSPRRGEAPAPHLKQAKPVPLGAGFGPVPTKYRLAPGDALRGHGRSPIVPSAIRPAEPSTSVTAPDRRSITIKLPHSGGLDRLRAWTPFPQLRAAEDGLRCEAGNPPRVQAPIRNSEF